ncbi:MAG TPA: DUF1761 domain-containing protein [Nevskiaceae bacterium]|nr:DUF1761 domain-containing protein [Nevskiaceae bacterium]
MEVQVNWLAVLLATASSMVVGSIWYAKPVFGNMWIKLAKVDEKKMQGNDSYKALGIALVASFVTAYVLAHVSYLSNQFFHDSFFKDAVSTAFWVGLGFSATTLVTHYAFEQKAAALTWLNVGNRMTTILVMGLIIGWLKP